MHLDIPVPECIPYEAIIHKMGQEYLASENRPDLQLTPNECNLCCQETAFSRMLESLTTKVILLLKWQAVIEAGDLIATSDQAIVTREWFER